jgi:DNA-binding NtrC family response regulator
MAVRVQQKRGPDRRRQPRGGRRPTDGWGYAPLVFVIDSRPIGRDACEAILAKLRFAVAQFETVDQAMRVVNALRPDIVVTSGAQIDELRDAMAQARDQQAIPTVAIPEQDGDAMALVEAIRGTLRLTPARS